MSADQTQTLSTCGCCKAEGSPTPEPVQNRPGLSSIQYRMGTYASFLLAMMEDNLRKRKFGDTVRLEVSQTMPREMIEYLTESIGAEQDDIYKVSAPMGLSDFWFLYGLNRPDLKEAPIRESVPACLQTGESIFDIVKRRDVLLHHPFNSYSIITDLIKQAAEDDDVLAIKICLYRTGLDSPIPPALIEASERGKQVTVVIEIKARFDEANNIEWAKQLERAGVQVVSPVLITPDGNTIAYSYRRMLGELLLVRGLK